MTKTDAVITQMDALTVLTQITSLLSREDGLEAGVSALLPLLTALFPECRITLAILPPDIPGKYTGIPRKPQARESALPRNVTADIWTLTAGSADCPPEVVRVPRKHLDSSDDIGSLLQAALWNSPATHPADSLVLPLVSGGITMGALHLVRASGQPLDPKWPLLAQQVAGQIAHFVRLHHLTEQADWQTRQWEWSLQEVQHRIGNNLQILTSILDVYRMEADSDAYAARHGLNHALREVQTIAAVHDLLSLDTRGSHVNARWIVERLVPLLLSAPTSLGLRVHAEVEAEDLTLPGKPANALALAANELITNAVQHGAGTRKAVNIRVQLQTRGGLIRLCVKDDGPGFAPDFNLKRDSKVGLSLVETLIVRDHDGTLHVESRPGGYVCACIPAGIALKSETTP